MFPLRGWGLGLGTPVAGFLRVRGGRRGIRRRAYGVHRRRLLGTPRGSCVARSRGERERDRRRLRPSRFWFLGAAGPAAAGEGRRAGAAAGRPSHSPPCSRHPARGYRRHLWTARRRRRVRRGRRGSPSSAPQPASPPLPTLRSRGCACSVARTFSRVHSAARREAGAGVPRAPCPRRPRPSCRSWRARRGRRRPCSAAG